jgi:hypothetical protein
VKIIGRARRAIYSFASRHGFPRRINSLTYILWYRSLVPTLRSESQLGPSAHRKHNHAPYLDWMRELHTSNKCTIKYVNQYTPYLIHDHLIQTAGANDKGNFRPVVSHLGTYGWAQPLVDGDRRRNSLSSREYNNQDSQEAFVYTTVETCRKISSHNQEY